MGADSEHMGTSASPRKPRSGQFGPSARLERAAVAYEPGE